jgi:hypothetical protein
MFDMKKWVLPSRYLPMLCGLGMLLTINLSYLLAAANGHVEWCVPYWDSCTSISATGRRLPESIIFKGLMIPVAIMIMVYWNTAYHWLRQWCDKSKHSLAFMLILGIAAALLLIIYSFTLGIHGQLFRHFRHIVVIFAFTLTYLAQLLFTWQLFDGVRRHHLQVANWVCRSQMGLCIVILLVGTSSIVLGVFYPGYEDIEDAFEWDLAFLLNLHFILTFFIWRKTMDRFSGVSGDP